MKQAIIDLGTNTFHLLIAETDGPVPHTLFRESRPAKIGQAGINQGIITEEGIERALGVLTYFRQILDQHRIDPDRVMAIGTSAIRVARNQQEFIDRMKQATGLSIQVISGDQEAGYIYQGIRAANEVIGAL